MPWAETQHSGAWKRDLPRAFPKLSESAPERGFLVTHEECSLPFVLIHQKDIKRMTLKTLNSWPKGRHM